MITFRKFSVEILSKIFIIFVLLIVINPLQQPKKES